MTVRKLAISGTPAEMKWEGYLAAARVICPDCRKGDKATLRGRDSWVHADDYYCCAWDLWDAFRTYTAPLPKQRPQEIENILNGMADENWFTDAADAEDMRRYLESLGG